MCEVSVNGTRTDNIAHCKGQQEKRQESPSGGKLRGNMLVGLKRMVFNSRWVRRWWLPNCIPGKAESGLTDTRCGGITREGDVEKVCREGRLSYSSGFPLITKKVEEDAEDLDDTMGSAGVVARYSAGIDLGPGCLHRKMKVEYLDARNMRDTDEEMNKTDRRKSIGPDTKMVNIYGGTSSMRDSYSADQSGACQARLSTMNADEKMLRILGRMSSQGSERTSISTVGGNSKSLPSATDNDTHRGEDAWWETGSQYAYQPKLSPSYIPQFPSLRDHRGGDSFRFEKEHRARDATRGRRRRGTMTHGDDSSWGNNELPEHRGREIFHVVQPADTNEDKGRKIFYVV